MANTVIRIGTRESPLAVWQAAQVQNLLAAQNLQSELVYIKSEGDTDLITPLYALGVQGIFTKTLDAALLNNRIDIAVHSMKDVPVQMAEGIVQAAVLKRGSYRDIFVPHPNLYDRKAKVNKVYVSHLEESGKKKKTERISFPLREHSDNPEALEDIVVATSSVRRIAQWLNRFPDHKIENLRGNVNTRLRKLGESNWHGAIFAAAGLERIGLRPKNAIELNWMLPAPAQGAITVVCRKDDKKALEYCRHFNDETTALCVKIERDFLKTLMGGCSTPIGALAAAGTKYVHFNGNILSPDGKEKLDIAVNFPLSNAGDVGKIAGEDILSRGGDKIIEQIRNAGK
ncbi:hydroxymethylbilane synthase [Parafilimonas sp.]|uniref:hydroxymethylbilane synthase n=1 Tax=Parafilimonas sp. TaxID=1969739 RepID=UPI0039E3DB9D